jgi:tetratricopeptide (TPR) repeat protein
MTCTEVDERGLAEAYLLGRLSESERDAYEAHYFECARCYSELQALRDVQDALRATPAAAPARPWVWAAIAATLVLASSAIAWVALRPGTSGQASVIATAPAPPSLDVQEMTRLAAVTPPPYEPRRLRSAEPREAFTSGMAKYRAGDYAGAVPLLERAVAQEPEADDARFYFGASQLLTGNAAAAIATLKRVADREGSPYAEEARFLTAKAHLRGSDVAAAIADLDRTIALHGAREQDAAALRDRLRSIR